MNDKDMKTAWEWYGRPAVILTLAIGAMTFFYLLCK